jgi:hypothetical protein
VKIARLKVTVLATMTVLALNLAIPPVTAQPLTAQPLAPGKPAGVKQANVWDPTTLAVIAGGTAIVVGFALAISSTTPAIGTISGGAGNSVVVTPTTTTTR